MSINSIRARKLLRGGLLGGHLAAVLGVISFGAILGLPGGVSAAISGAVVLLFFTIGQAVMVIVADRNPKVVLFAAVCSYLGRVSILGIVLMLALDNLDKMAFLQPAAVVITTFATVVSWLGSEYWVFSKLRIPHFDSPETESIPINE